MEQYIQLPKKLGKGSFGTVALVQRKSDGQLFAMKMIDIECDNVSKNPYLNEINILKKVQHPNVIKYQETFISKECLCLIMEYCENGDLQKKIKEAKANNYHFSEDQIMEWFCQLCLAVKYLHDNHVIHRDIKVHNIFLTSNGLIKLGDFGISKQLDNTNDLSQTHTGTPLYLTPEMILYSTSSYKSDIWMLGCLLHELCSLQKPFKGDTLPEVVHQIIKKSPTPIPEFYSPFMHKLVYMLLEKDPEKRPSIYSLLTIPEVQKYVFVLKTKYLEVYSNSITSIDDDKESSVYRKTLNSTSDTESTSLSSILSSVERSRSFPTNIIPQSSNNDLMGNQLQNSKTLQTEQRQSEKPSLALMIEDQSFLGSKARRSNNIWSLVQQKRAHPASEKKPPGAKKEPEISSRPQDNVLSSKETNTGVTQPTLCQGPEEEKVQANNTSFSRKGEKETENSRKSHRLSIRIPGASPDQSHVKDFKFAAETTRETNTQDALKVSARDNSSDSNAIPTSKTTAKKEFTFSRLIFENKSPVSPSRSMWVPQFLKGKLGTDKYNQVLEFLGHSSNPLEILKEQPELVLNIIGESNRECLVMLSFLMAYNSNSVTPTANKESDWEKNKGKMQQLKSPEGIKKGLTKIPKKVIPQRNPSLGGNTVSINEKRQASIGNKDIG